jgi:hypothetical protein
MHDGGVGRLLVASLHQGIADLLPTRLEFYESWLNSSGLRDGRIGLAPLAAVLSFLRSEGEPYYLVAARAGEYTAEWSVAEVAPWYRAFVQLMPPGIRTRLVTRMAQQMIRSTYGGSRVLVRRGKDGNRVDIRGSVFCEVREAVAHPLCEYYAAALRRLMHLFQLDVDVQIESCRGAGGTYCLMTMLVRPATVAL